MNTFHYNEETRVHTLNGIIIPSVSQIISPLSDFSMIPPKILARKCELGIQFHKAIELHMLDDLCMDSLDPDLIKPMETFAEWWNLEKDRNEFLFAEKPLCHRTLKYCGKPDIVMVNGIYDIKLRPFNHVTDPLQMEGYEHLLHREPNRFKPLFKKVLSFDIKGKMKIHDARSSQGWQMFVALLKHYNKPNPNIDKLIKSWVSQQKER